MVLYLDIETIEDDPDTFDDDLRSSLVRDLGDPDAADRDALGRLALSPLTGSIAVCAAWDTDKGGVCFAVVDDEEHDLAPGFRLIPCDNEAELVTMAWKTIAARQRLVTWNGDEFDKPFLIARAAVHGVRVPDWVLDAKPWESRVVDVCHKLAGPDRFSRRSLECACRAFGVRSPKTRLSGSEVGAAWKAGRRLEVAIYCCDDVRALAEVGERYGAAVGWTPGRFMPPAPAIEMPSTLTPSEPEAPAEAFPDLAEALAAAAAEEKVAAE